MLIIKSLPLEELPSGLLLTTLLAMVGAAASAPKGTTSPGDVAKA
jgi:hypothetical protein